MSHQDQENIRRSQGRWTTWSLWVGLGVALLIVSSGCSDLGSDLFPNSPNGSFINTSALGQGPTSPTGPSSNHTTANPTGR